MNWLFDNPIRLIILPVGLLNLLVPSLVRYFLLEIYKLNGSKGRFVVDDEKNGPYDKKNQLLYIRLVGITLLSSLAFT